MSIIADDAELAAHLAEVAGKLLLIVRDSGLLSLKALGKAGDQTANQFLCHAIREQRPDDGADVRHHLERRDDAAPLAPAHDVSDHCGGR